MQRFIITSLLVLASFAVRADDRLILTKVEDLSHLHSLFENQDLTIHYYNDSFIVASLEEGKTMAQGSVILDETAFADCNGYYIVYCEPSQQQAYLSETQHAGKVLYSEGDILIMKPLSEKSQLFPAKNDGMVRISQQQASLPKRTFGYPVITEIDPLVQELAELVNTDNIIATVQHLQDYGTRRCDHANSVLAQNWLIAQYEALDLDVELHSFSAYPWWGGSCVSGNVIAVQPGTTSPDEYIVCGCHYDSFAYQSPQGEPGADDNATGTAGILEIARILSQYEFERSIIYCSFSAEECGLYGSDAYALRCSQQGMDILGYFNIDMSGYLQPGATQMTISIIRATVAAPLDTYYTNIANIYFPEVNITHHTSMYGDSDHSSFVKYGYLGIYPFENNSAYSPYIHSPDDIIGLSVNKPEQCRVFTQVSLASIVTLAGISSEPPPPLPVVDFSASETTIVAGDMVQFTDLSTNDPVEWHWYFESGTPPESVEQNPEVLYETAGSYYVKLVATNVAGSDSLTRQNYITVKEPILPPIVDFVADTTVIEEGETVTFTDLSTNNPTEWHWFFEGGEPEESEQQNPVVLYPTAGTYSVSLTAANEAGESTELKENYITVTPKTSIAEHDATDGIVVYPNPTTGLITITCYRHCGLDPQSHHFWEIAGQARNDIQNVEIFDVFGRTCNVSRGTRNENEMDISLLPTGIYFIRIQTETGVVVRKVVKR